MKFPGHSQGIYPAVEFWVEVAYCSRKKLANLRKELYEAYLLHGYSKGTAWAALDETIYHEDRPLIVAPEEREGLERITG